MTYEAFTVQCKWLSEGRGGFVAIADESIRFEDAVETFCENNNMQPTGGVSITAWGTTLLVTQACIPIQPGFRTDPTN
jgi:hypothetical protein